MIYASFSRRMWAATFDSLLLLLFVAPFLDMGLNALLGAPPPLDWIALTQAMDSAPDSAGRLAVAWQALSESRAGARFLVNTILQTVLLLALTGLCWRRWSATPGKILLRMRVVDAQTGGPISPRQIVIRLVGYIVSTLPLMLGFFWLSFNRRRQAWHDKMAGTVVVVINRNS